MTAEADHVTLTLAPNDTASTTNSIAGNRKSLRRVSSCLVVVFVFGTERIQKPLS